MTNLVNNYGEAKDMVIVTKSSVLTTETAQTLIKTWDKTIQQQVSPSKTTIGLFLRFLTVHYHASSTATAVLGMVVSKVTQVTVHYASETEYRLKA